MQFSFYSESHLPQVNTAVADFVSQIIWDEPDRFVRYCTMAVINDDRLVGGVVFHGWQPDTATIEVSAGTISPRWLTRDVINAAISMPFEILGCQAIYAHHAESNVRARRFWQRLGAVEHVIPRLRGRDEAEVVAVLTDDAWAISPYSKQKVKCRG